jgi:putative ABC transport system permease protein
MTSALPNLLRFFAARHVNRHRVRTALGFTAVLLGVALYVSADVANESVLAALQGSGRELAGSARWQVMRARSIGIELGMLAAVRALPGAVAAPVIQTSATMVEPAPAPLYILGVDLASESSLRLWRAAGAAGSLDPAAAVATLMTPDAILLARPLAQAHGIAPGARIALDTRAGRRSFTVTGLLDAAGPARMLGGGLGVIGIGMAQQLFRQPGWVDRIDVAGVSREALVAACPGCVVEPAQHPAPLIEDALARLRSLVAISVIAVLVGIFIVYNTVAVAILERLKEVGTLRAIGARRSEIQRALLVEWAIVGAAGSVAGIAAGYGLAKVLIAFTAKTINALAQVVEVRETLLQPTTAGLAVVIGIGSTLAAAWFPVRRALARPPVDILRAHAFRRQESYRAALWVGLSCIALGLVLIWVLRRFFTIGLVSTAAFFLGLALVLPQLTVWTARRIRPLLARLCRIEGFLAADNIAKFPLRTALTVTALGGALAMMVASATLIAAFREASRRWLDYTLPFDLAVSSTDFSRAVYGGNAFPAAIEDEVRKQPCVAQCYGVRAGFCDADGNNVMVIGVEFEGFARAQRRRPPGERRQRFEEPGLLERLLAGDVCVSENYAELHGTGVGDRISLATRSGPVALTVLAAIDDYSWPRGVVFMDLARYRQLFGDQSLNYVDVLLQPGWSRDDARAQLVRALGGAYSVYVFTKGDILKLAEDTLDQLMALSNIQVFVAVIIGFLGIVNTLLISVLQRTREVGLLRAIGMSRAQVGRTVVLEALLMAVVGGGLGIAVGLGGGWYPLRLFTLHMTGYLPPLVVPWLHVAVAGGLAVLIGAVAAFVPARAAARLNVLEAIGYE